MRAREFIKLSEEDVNITLGPEVTDDLPSEPVFISPLQQELEISKHQIGKKSQVINQIVNGGGDPGDDPGTVQTPGLARRRSEPLASIYAAKGNPVEPNSTFSNTSLTRKVK